MDAPSGIHWELSNCDFVSISKVRLKDGRIVYRFWNDSACTKEERLEFSEQDFEQWIDDLKSIQRENPDDDDEDDDEESN